MRKDCPFCQIRGLTPDTKQHLYLLPAPKKYRSPQYYCHRCGAKGYAGPKTLWLHKNSKTSPKPESFELFTFNFLPEESKPIRDYLLTRGLGQEDILRRARWSPDIPGRAIFPLYVGGVPKVLSCRAVDKREPKYLTYGPMGHYVYGLDEVETWAVVCEGVISALNTPHGVALYSKHLTIHQRDLLASRYSLLINAIENDNPAAIKDKKRFTTIMSNYMPVYEINFEPGQDPATLGFKAMEEKIRVATAG